MQPWTSYPEMRPDHARGFSGWNVATHPFLVTWTIALPDRLTRSTSHVRAFASEAEARVAYSAPAKCWQVRLQRFDASAPVGTPGSTIAKRKPAALVRRAA